MHLEYRCYLGELVTACKDLPLKKAPLAEVDDCPTEYHHILSTNICFQLADAARKSNLPLHAAEIAKMLLLSHEERSRSGVKFFEISIGGDGYLNATPTEIFQKQFGDALQREQGAALFQRASFVVAKGEAAEPVSMLTVRPEKLLETYRHVSHSKHTPAAPKNRRNADVERFLCCRLVDMFDDQLMLLALLADPELEVEPYEQNLFGRQNIPWYFRKFLQDTSELVCDLKKRCNGKAGTLNTTSPLLEPLLHFRKFFFAATDWGAIPEFVNYLVRIVQEFYRFYNRPQTRRALAESGEAFFLAQMADTIEVLHSVFARSLYLLEASCKNVNFALKES